MGKAQTVGSEEVLKVSPQGQIYISSHSRVSRSDVRLNGIIALWSDLGELLEFENPTLIYHPEGGEEFQILVINLNGPLQS